VDIGRLENGQFIVVFFANDGHFIIADSHGNRLNRTSPLCLELAASLPLSHLCRLPLDSKSGEAANELDDVNDAGGRTAEERQKNGRRTASQTLLSSPRRTPSSGHVGRLQTTENQTILSGFLLQRRPSCCCLHLPPLSPNRAAISR
jgi:hypothetical protein